MKIFKFFLSFAMFLLVGIGCSPTNLNNTLQPACTDTIETDIILDVSYLGFCGKIHEGSTQPMKVNITVDGIAFDANGVDLKLSYLGGGNFNRDNEHDLLVSSSSTNTRTFRIPVPRCGSYAITVNVRGTDNSCFTCCQTSSTIPNPGNCAQVPGSSKKGSPKFRAVTAKINVDLANPPAPQYFLKPMGESCENCGC